MPREPSSRTTRAVPFSPFRAGLIAALPLVTVQVVLPVVWRSALEHAQSLPGLVPALFALASGALAWSYSRARRLSGAVSPAGILLVALLLRLLALPLAPALSNDVQRYVWDGRVVLAGENPYRLAPDDPALAPLRERSRERLDHLDHLDHLDPLDPLDPLDHGSVPTVYPPLALGLFAFAAALPAPVLALKVLLAMADLAGCAALLALARHLGLPAERAIWYAWNPLVVIETAGMGHVDALGVAAVIAAALWVARRRPAGAGRAIGTGAWIAAGTLAKLAPLLALPFWARRSGRPAVVVAVAAAILLAALAPVVALTGGPGGVPPGLITYGVSWEFDGPLYEPLHRLLDAAGAGEAAKRGLDRLKVATGEHGVWNRFYPYAYPRLFAKMLLALALLVGVVRSLLDRRQAAEVTGVTGPGALFGVALLTSATVYPWYLLWVLPWAALALQPAWLLAAATAPLAYLVAMPGTAGGPIEPFPWIWLAVWGPPAVLALASRRARHWSAGSPEPLPGEAPA